MQAVSRNIQWKMLAPYLVTFLIAAVLTGGVVAAVTITQNESSLMGARATTVEFTEVTAIHGGTHVASTGEAGATAATIVSSATDATDQFRAETVAAGDYVYLIKFESTDEGDDIPAGTVRGRWTIDGVEQTVSLSVSTTVVTAPARGGFTLVIPGDEGETPEDIQLVYEQ